MNKLLLPSPEQVLVIEKKKKSNAFMAEISDTNTSGEVLAIGDAVDARIRVGDYVHFTAEGIEKIIIDNIPIKVVPQNNIIVEKIKT